MKLHIILIGGIITFSYLACAITISCPSNVVGYEGKNLNLGWNEIELNFDATGPFPVFTTLDKLVEFYPGESMIGDEMVFDLDGYHQKYRIVGYDTGTKKFTLTKIRKKDNIPEQISFDWIPAPKVFWINHVSTNTVTVIQSGEVDNRFRRLVYSDSCASTGQASTLLRILPVNPNSKELHLTLQGGRIEQCLTR